MRIKNQITSFTGEVMTGVMNSKVLRFGTPLSVLLGSTASVFATGKTADGDAGKSLETNLTKAMGVVYAWIVGISTALAILLISWNVLKYMAATDPQTAMMAKKNAIRVAIAWVILNSMGAAAKLLSSLKGDDAGTEIWGS